jgi:membrane dipeptidase
MNSAHAQRALVWDNHSNPPFRADARFLPQLERYWRAGVSVVSLNAGGSRISWAEIVNVLSFMRRWIAQRGDRYRLISTVSDIQRSREEGKLGVAFDIEGTYAVQDAPHLLQAFYELGVRWMLLTYNRNDAAGGGCLDVDGGLTATGRELIDEMERVGMVLCLSHTGARTAAEAIEYSRNPTIFSHSNPSRQWDSPRNVSDQLMRACARKGGVIGLNGLGPYLGTDADPVPQLLRHLRYAIDLIGAEHVGIGLDHVFDRESLDDYVRLNPALVAPGFEAGSRIAMTGPEQIEAIAEGLARENLTDSQIRGVLGENWLRIATQVWR